MLVGNQLLAHSNENGCNMDERVECIIFMHTMRAFVFTWISVYFTWINMYMTRDTQM